MNMLCCLLGIGIIICTITMICNTKDEDMGCDFDCGNCPFPHCSDEDIKRLKKNRK